MSTPILVLTAFLASAVEMVEAVTIILAVGLTRGWRAAIVGTVAGLLAIALVVAALGPALVRLVPLQRPPGRDRNAAVDVRSAVVTQGHPARGGSQGET
jgi:hypothetical protein